MLLHGAAFLVATLLLLLPLAVVFTEALRSGLSVAVASLGHPDAVAAIWLTLLVTAIVVPVNTLGAVSLFVARFLGACVRFEGEVRDGWFRPDAAEIAPIETDIHAGRAVALVRPYDLLLRQSGAAQAIGSRASGGLVYVRTRTGHRGIEVLAPDGTPDVPAGAAFSLQARNGHVFPLFGAPAEIRPASRDVRMDEKV